jgi:hypothetical protein
MLRRSAFAKRRECCLAKSLFIVEDDVFGTLPETVQKTLLGEVKKLFSFIPGFTVKALKPTLIPATLHFTDSVVKFVQSNDEVEGAVIDIRRQEDANIRSSIQRSALNLTLQPFPASIGNPEKGGNGGFVKPTVLVAGQVVSLTITWGVASLEFAEQAVVGDMLQGRTLEDILKQRLKIVAKKGLGYYAKHESLISVREEIDAELATKHKPLKDWPVDRVANVIKALARSVAHEARHQYLEDHSTKGLGADEPTLFGDKKFEQFDGTDQANIVTAIN